MGGITDGANWIQSRILKLHILFLYALLIVALWLIFPPDRVAHFFVISLFSAALLVMFRLWDDLSDREYDKENNVSDDRVLVTSKHIKFFVVILTCALATTGFALYQVFGIRSLLLYVVLCCYLALLYYLPLLKQRSRIQREILVLIKYPLFLLLLSQVISLKSIGVSLVLYAVLISYYLFECRHVDH